MTSMRWMRGGLVVFMTLAPGALAQDLDPPPGAAVDEPPAPPPPPPPSSGAAPLAESPYWDEQGGSQEEFAEEFGVEEGDPAIDEGSTSDADFDERSESLAESSSLGGPTGLMRVLSATSGAPGTFRFSLL